MRKLQELFNINVIFAHLRNIFIFNVKSLRLLTNFFVIFILQILHFNNLWRKIFELNVQIIQVCCEVSYALIITLTYSFEL